MLRSFITIMTIVAACYACGPDVSPQYSLDGDLSGNGLSRLDVHGQKLFLNGVNLAWNRFGRDFGDFSPDINGYDRDYFSNTFHTVAQAGGNAMRIWVHTSGEFNPKHDAQGFYICKDQKFFDDLKDMLDLADQHHILVMLTLWSFDMLDLAKSPNIYGDDIIPRNKALLTDNRYTDAYINNCYVKILDAVKGKPALLAIEVINEPEGMTSLQNWTSTGRVTMGDVQKFISRIASVTHQKAPGIKVTSGALNGDFLGYYTDQALTSASGLADGTLDFFAVHYYDNGTNPLTTDARVLSPTKPIIVGEFSSTYANLSDLYESIFAHGYAGAFTWKFKETPGDTHGSWGDGRIAAALGNLAAKHPTALATQQKADAALAKSSDGYPTCQQSDSDPDHDGWGWENNTSCKVLR